MQICATRQFVVLAATVGMLIIAACNSHSATEQTALKPLLVAADTATIRQLFKTWQRQQLRAGTFWAADSCNARVIERQQPADIVLGLPSDSSDYNFSYADLNADSTLDGLVTFAPHQCDGGNGSMWTQVEVLLLSGPKGYSTIDTLNVKRFFDTLVDESGFFHLDSIAPNRLFGTYYEFGENSGHCCPSVQRPVVFDFHSRRQLR